ncbi:MAG: hypothetical protein K1W35_05710 [Lachnospiraceae bacterium]
MVSTNKIPRIYKEMESRGFFNDKTYLRLDDMEWMSVKEIEDYEYEEGESCDIIPFAMTGGGDKWVWVTNKNNYIGICDHADTVGEFYACSMEDAILRQIFEYVAGGDFYIDENESNPFQESEEDLKNRLDEWRLRLSGIVKDEYLNIIDDLGKLHLKKLVQCRTEYYALLSSDELDELIDRYIKFDLMDKEFEWCTEEYFKF